MTLAEEQKRKRLIAIVLGCVAGSLVIYQGFNLFGGSSTPATPPPATVVMAPTRPGGPAAVMVGKSSSQLDPTLHEEAMLVTESLVYSGTGRNIFSGTVEAPPVVIPATLTSARNHLPTPPPAPTTPPPPPGPPPINLKFFGTATSQNGTRRAFLLNGDDVFIASVGDIVQRRYRVVSIAANSILVEDIPNTNKQTLPLTGN
jgi:hypothetical protein